ncbi:ENTH/VHS domain-containing protein [Schizosaccharomyces cryophilus OY26]|uniref:ENTH/VHS domain-containing protein n=1 Tax=Schizosaccharomyces cryophilus (strain OY26 / ATCC MYA-4695 / CBS 11777 / NBRC 106824 / NRRL Y48691) TaxID=653667 RepID=S9XAA9_SCHCR|nr:ENTH/VHS domain-containing protein [Schizosaccharomyces cryophilus OY26]EPY50706.1 ENTH/VHS domain-containing protein [Schizosaccharomyces cryophilus OY26]
MPPSKWMSSYDRAVKKATKIKLAAPKSKHVELILQATFEDPDTLDTVIQDLCERMKDSSWTVVFKSLIVFHLMLKDGSPGTTIVALSQRPRILEVVRASSLTTQGQNIYNYSRFLSERVKQYGRLGFDYAQASDGAKKLKQLTVDNGLMRHVEGIQSQLRRLLKCQFLVEEIDNDITVTSFRLLVGDLLVLFKAVNIGVIKLLEHYFEMSHPDAEQSLRIYKTFVRQTEDVINFLSTARSLEFVTKFPVPNIKHAPISLTASLEEYLNDPDFEQNRNQYMNKKTNPNMPRNVFNLSESIHPQAPEGSTKEKLSLPKDNASSFVDEMLQEGNNLPLNLKNSSPSFNQTAFDIPSIPQQSVPNSLNPFLNASIPYQPQQPQAAPMSAPQMTGNPYAQIPYNSPANPYVQNSSLAPPMQIDYTPSPVTNPYNSQSRAQSVNLDIRNPFQNYIRPNTLQPQSTGFQSPSMTPAALQRYPTDSASYVSTEIPSSFTGAPKGLTMERPMSVDFYNTGANYNSLPLSQQNTMNVPNHSTSTPFNVSKNPFTIRKSEEIERIAQNSTIGESRNPFRV